MDDMPQSYLSTSLLSFLTLKYPRCRQILHNSIPCKTAVSLPLFNMLINHAVSSSKIDSSSSFLKGRLNNSVPIESLWLVMIWWSWNLFRVSR